MALPAKSYVQANVADDDIRANVADDVLANVSDDIMASIDPPSAASLIFSAIFHNPNLPLALESRFVPFCQSDLQ